MQKITDIQIIPIKPNNGHVGFASFIYDDSLYCSSIGIYTRPQGGFRLSYPTRKAPTASLSIFHPINKETTDMIEAAVVSKYEQLIGTAA
ncbi:MAG TPA: septation protein SpoVG family protein [Candidatus Dependentiae bacterium]|nr:septation protein SpoVG family protein [Candidatus Dependentiae bacterium]HRQ63194.1 septation protein SpoVG family protein [Candidatus Dependentiae bacterium]